MKCRRFDGFGKLKSVEVKNQKMDTETVPYQPRALFWGRQLSGSVSNPY